MYGQKSISQSLLDAVNTAMFEDIHPQAQSLLKHIKPEHHSTYKPFLAKGTFNGSHKDKTDVLNAAKQAGHLVSENIEEGFKELMQDVKDRAGPQPKGHIGQKAGTRYGGAGQKDDEREKETERLEKKKEMKKEDMDFKNRLIESLKGNQHKIDKNKNNKIDSQDFKILRTQKEEVEDVNEVMDEPNYKNSIQARQAAADKDFKDRQARLAAAGKETAKDPVRLKRLSSIPGYTAAMNLAKKTTKEEVELDEAGEVKAPTKGLTVDTLAGPKKAPKGFEKDNEHTSAKVPLKTEEVEQIEELKKSTMGSYVKKASKDLHNTSFDHGEDEHRQYGDPDDTERENEMKKRERDIKNRQKGINRAASKLTKEGKRPESDTVPFVTDAAQSPKERLRAAFGKVKKEMSNGY